MRACMLLSTVLQIRVNVTKPWLHFQSISMHASRKDEQMLHRTCGNWTEASVFLRLHIIIDVNVVDKIQFNFSPLFFPHFNHQPTSEWTGNLLVILVVTLSRRLRSITNFFLANLAVADFCVGIFCVYQNLSLYLIER